MLYHITADFPTDDYKRRSEVLKKLQSLDIPWGDDDSEKEWLDDAQIDCVSAHVTREYFDTFVGALFALDFEKVEVSKVVVY